MRKTVLALSVAAAAAFSTPVAAQAPLYDPPPPGAELAAGAVVGTLFGLSLSEAWWGSSFAGYALPASAGMAAAAGGVAGIGTVVAIHAFTTPCQGAHAFFSGLFTSPEGCVNGRWVGVEAAPPPRTRHR